MGFDSEFDVFDEGYTERDWDSGAEGTVRIALIGLGWFSRDEALPAIEECKYAEVTATVSGSIEKAREVADEADTDTALTYEDYHDGIGADNYDAVYVCTPNALHLEHVETAVNFGKDVICEKPMEATVQRAEAMVEACNGTDTTLMIAYRMHSDPVVRRTRTLISNGFVGDVAQIEGAYSYSMFVQGDGNADQWRLDPSLAGGGSLYDIGIYPLNTTRYVLEENPVSVEGSLTSPGEEFEGPVIDQHAAAILEFEEGAQALLRSSYGSFGQNYLVIEGDEGRITIDDSFDVNVPRTVILERSGHTARYEGLDVNELTEEFDYFAHCCLSDESPYANGNHGLFDMRTLEAIQTSASDGHRIELD